jgi:hypothetical protein
MDHQIKMKLLEELMDAMDKHVGSKMSKKKEPAMVVVHEEHSVPMEEVDDEEPLHMEHTKGEPLSLEEADEDVSPAFLSRMKSVKSKRDSMKKPWHRE